MRILKVALLLDPSFIPSLKAIAKTETTGKRMMSRPHATLATGYDVGPDHTAMLGRTFYVNTIGVLETNDFTVLTTSTIPNGTRVPSIILACRPGVPYETVEKAADESICPGTEFRSVIFGRIGALVKRSGRNPQWLFSADELNRLIVSEPRDAAINPFDMPDDEPLF